MTGENNGRLGNQMYLYAALYSTALENKRIPYMSPPMAIHLSKYFNVSMSSIDPNFYHCITWTNIPINSNRNSSDPQVRRITEIRAKLVGFPNSYKWFEKNRKVILKEFVFNSETESAVMRRISEAISAAPVQNTTTVGVHVRRGDYLDYSRVIHIEMPTVEFFAGAMEYFSLKSSNVVFIVVSDEIEWCIQNFRSLTNKFNVKFLNTSMEHGGIDLAVLAKCNHVIYGFGSFGFWGGYLSGGEAVFCSDCVTSETTWVKLHGDYSNAVLPSWIGFDRQGKRGKSLAVPRHDSY